MLPTCGDAALRLQLFTSLRLQVLVSRTCTEQMLDLSMHASPQCHARAAHPPPSEPIWCTTFLSRRASSSHLEGVFDSSLMLATVSFAFCRGRLCSCLPACASLPSALARRQQPCGLHAICPMHPCKMSMVRTLPTHLWGSSF